MTYVDYDAQRKLRRAGVSTSGMPPRPPQIQIPADQVVPQRCTYRGEQFGTLNCGCKSATKVFVCGNGQASNDWCVTEDIDRRATHVYTLDRSTKWPIDGRIAICALCKKKRAFDWLDRVAIGITEHLRPDDLSRLMHSIEQFMPGVEVLVQHTEGNLSKARNLLAAKIADSGKPYYFLMEEDVELTAASVVGLDKAVAMMDTDQQLASVGGAWINTRQNRVQFWSHMFIEDDQTITIQKDQPDDVEPVACQIHENFGLFRCEPILRDGWDEEIPIGHEHWEFFYRTRHLKRAALRSFEALHHNTRPGGAYNAARSRNYLRVGEEKHGKQWVNPGWRRDKVARQYHRLILPPGHSRRPNLLITGSGRCGTGLAVQMAEQLGWRSTGDLEYHEDARFVLANQEIMDNQEHSVPLAELIGSLPEPWVLKDPRFSRTIETWIGLFRTQRTKPLLLVLYREVEDVQRSYEKAGWNGNAAAMTQSAMNAFELWPWGKWLVKYEDLVRAACLVQCSPQGLQ